MPVLRYDQPLGGVGLLGVEPSKSWMMVAACVVAAEMASRATTSPAVIQWKSSLKRFMANLLVVLWSERTGVERAWLCELGMAMSLVNL